MKTTLKFNIYTDPGHGWVKVPRDLLTKLGIADKITRYSYIRNEYAYLEEDCDLSTFARALESLGTKLELKSLNSNKSSKIRSYKRYTFA